MSKSTLLVLGNQLFSLGIIQSIGADNISVSYTHSDAADE